MKRSVWALMIVASLSLEIRTVFAEDMATNSQDHLAANPKKKESVGVCDHPNRTGMSCGTHIGNSDSDLEDKNRAIVRYARGH
ncbi:hypothetical protein JNC05_03270 [Paraburkholderia ginsengiterrae]|nr:hypothetical protein [Paraburkholderia ginsengiterrae]